MWLLPGAAGVLAGLLGMVAAYRRSMDETTAQQAASQIADTPCGPIEYTESGEGLPVLIAHSSGGGFDQGIATGRRFPGCRVIAPSRAGYLRTPLESGPTPAHMADTFAALLDLLQIERAVMVGWSAGGMSALEFALRHPARCGGLVLGAAITQPPPGYVLDVLAPLALANRSDFLNWLIGAAAAATANLRAIDEDTRSILRVLARSDPASARRAGFELDLVHMRTFRPNLSRIVAPTLILHGTLDPLVPLAHAQQAAQAIPSARLVILPGGSHDSPVQYPDIVGPALQSFLDEVRSR